MKFIYSIILSFVLVHSFTQTDNRTTRMKVMDVTLQLPASNSSDLTQLMKELYPVAPDAVRIITENLQNTGVTADAQLKFALNGLVSYLSKDPDKAIVNETANALISSLATTISTENKNFYLEQLHFIASENHLPSLQGFLLRDEFADATARLMTKLKGSIANDILLKSYSIANDFQRGHIAKALASSGNEKALGFLLDEFKDLDEKIQPVVLQNFAHFGFEKSTDLLKGLAEKENFAGDVNSNTHHYLNLIVYLYTSDKNVSANQNVLTQFFETPGVSTHLKTVALKALFKKDQKNTLPLLLKSVQTDDRILNQTAISLLSDMQNEEVSNQLFQILKKSKSIFVQEDLLQYFIINKFPSGVKVFSPWLNSSDNGLKVAAFKAVLNSEPASAFAKIPGLLNANSDLLTDEVRTQLMRSDKVTFDRVVAESYPKLNPNAKMTILELIGKRRSTALSNLVMAEAKSTNIALRDKAIGQLKYLVTQNDIKTLLSLLGSRNEKVNIINIQDALWSSMSEADDNKKRTLIGVSYLVNSKQVYKFYNIFTKLGSKEDLNLVKADVTKYPSSAEYALDAYSVWKDGMANQEVFEMATKSRDTAIKEKAILSYISLIIRSKNPEDQKLLLLKKIEPELKESRLQIPYVRALGQINTIQSLSAINKYLDNADTRQTAINAIFNIVQNSEISGQLAKEIVEKAIKFNTDSEALYIQEAVIKKMTAWSEDIGFVPLFNGKDMSGWKGLVGNPVSRSKMSNDQMEAEQKAANERMVRDWKVENGVLVFDGKGFDNICTTKDYEDFELLVDWRMEAKGDGGIYLRGTPQVQTWDTSRRDAGAHVGSGGLYNNQIYQSKPNVVADNPINEWNTFRIKMIGDKVTVHLNGVLVTDNVILENYWDKNLPIFKSGQIELQAHGTRLEFREIYIREIPKAKAYSLAPDEKNQGFSTLFDGLSLDNWQGNKIDYFAQEGNIVCKPTGKGNGNLYTAKEYSDFILKFDFQLTPGANNGLGIRTPLEGDAAYVGMELQILDNTAEIYKNLYEWQYHGSVYGVIPAKREYAKPVGEWNSQEVHVKGIHIKVILNGNVIVDGDLYHTSSGGTKTIDGKSHPGLLNKKGYIGFLGHGSPLKFRNIRIKEI